MKKNTALLMMAVLVLGLAACKKKSETEVTDTSTVNGTTIETTTSTETTTEDDGTVTTETNKETTVDPEGAMNKETTEESHTETVTEPVPAEPAH